ncbi:LysR family transcriptional regulator [Aquitalea denitrificans]|uniref:LysR family transcriptional regulator n=1 Tax=Aquitalea denitrificans TaxID=519081 RepID=UPI001F10A758|nr:LysR family transcriptional regulator [Aquitalea denitrificans]
MKGVGVSITLKNVRYFVAVAEMESISRAVQDLNVSQSVVTEAIRALEDDLGVLLFTRHARGMSLTHAGYQFLRHAHQILASVRHAREALSTRPDAVTGQLNIGVTSLVCGYFLPYLLERFRSTFPQVDVRVVEDQRDYIEHLLVNGELDAAVLIVSNVQNRQALHTEVLQQSSYRLWLPSGHRLLDGGVVTLSDLADQPLVALKLDELEDVATALWRQIGRKPQLAVRTASVEAMRSLVATGAGLAIMPDVLYRPWSLEGDRLEVLPLQEATPTLEVGVVWRRGMQVSDNTHNFLTLAREYSRSHKQTFS